MKLAIAGKGGVGKTTLAAALARQLAKRGRPVIAVDADPDGNLGAALGVPERGLPTPIAQMRDLIRERTGATEEGAPMFTMNPEVDDLLERFSVNVGGVRLLVLGTVKLGGKGCMCPEGTLLKALLQHVLLRLPEDMILDMEAGLEHMGRASARGVDAILTVVEPGMRSVQTADRIRRLASDIGIRRHLVVANKINSRRQEETLRRALGEQVLIGVLPYCDELVDADLQGRPVALEDQAFAAAVGSIEEALAKELAAQQSVAR